MTGDRDRNLMAEAKRLMGFGRPAAPRGSASAPALPPSEPALFPPPVPPQAAAPPLHRATASSGPPDSARPCGYIRIPYLAKAGDARPLQRTIDHAADRTGLSPFQVAMVVTYLFEGIAAEVGLGRVVRIPGFGIFGPWEYESKMNGAVTVQPRFYAARPFRLEVRGLCRPQDAKNDVLSAYARSHHPSSRPDKATSRTGTAMETWRKLLRAAAAFVGGG